MKHRNENEQIADLPSATASFSFLPLLLYMLYLFLFASGKLIPKLPQRYQSITNYLIVIFIPAILIISEIGSFVGISRRTCSVLRVNINPTIIFTQKQ